MNIFYLRITQNKNIIILAWKKVSHLKKIKLILNAKINITLTNLNLLHTNRNETNLKYRSKISY